MLRPLRSQVGGSARVFGRLLSVQLLLTQLAWVVPASAGLLGPEPPVAQVNPGADQGPGSGLLFDNGTLIDTDRRITWMADCRQPLGAGWVATPWMPMGRAVALLSRINHRGGGAFGYDDWRLPTADELAHLFVVEGMRTSEPELYRQWRARPEASGFKSLEPMVYLWPVRGSGIAPGFENVVLLATNSARLKNGADVASGDVVVNGVASDPLVNGYELAFDPQGSSAAGFALRANRIWLKSQVTIGGDVSYNTLRNQGQVLGALTTPLALPVFALLPPFWSAAPGTEQVEVADGGYEILPPGDYGEIEVGDDGTLVLSGGIYNILSLHLNDGASLLMQNATQVRIAGNLEAGHDAAIGPEAGSGAAIHDQVLYVVGSIETGTDSAISASLYAPNDLVHIGHSAVVTGAVIGRDVLVENSATLNLDSYFFNRAPVAGDDAATVDEGAATSQLDSGETSLLANDIDFEGDPLTVTTTAVVPPAHGNISLSADGTFTYIHDGSETTSDSFVYQVCDDGTPMLCDTATVAITVNPVNDPPTAVDDALVVAVGGTATTLVGGATSVLANDTDAEGNALTVDPTPVSGPLYGTVTLASDGTFAYTQSGAEVEGDAFEYLVCDDGSPSACSTATVVISVRAPIHVRISLSGLGSGQVSSDPAGIDCGATCIGLFNGIDPITLTAVPLGTSLFGGWSGDADCADGVLEPDGDKYCIARFDTGATATLSISLGGNGQVTSDIGGISCPGTCAFAYPLPSRVELAAVPDSGWAFVGWSGDAECTGGTVALFSDVSCTATFEELPPPPATFTLTILFVGPGSGSVSSNPSGVLCEADCTVELPQDLTLTLAARPDQLPFGGWGGDCSGSDTFTTLTMDGDKVCTVDF